MILKWLSIYLLSLLSLVVLASAIDPQYVQSKVAGFIDSNIGYSYQVRAYNVTSMTTDAVHRSIIRVTKAKIINQGASGAPEIIQTLPFHSTLVDFGLLCEPSHCYLVTITSRSRQNVELYAWKRTQFDLLKRMDSFARPHAVKLFKIQSSFYIAIAQHQIHLTPQRLIQDQEGSSRFIGCAILKFTRGHEPAASYHQFIRLPFDPLFVSFFTSFNSNNITSISSNRLTENHYLVFSAEPNWPETPLSYTFLWSSLDDYFWPYKLPQGVVVGPTPSGAQYPILRFEQPPVSNFPQQKQNFTQQLPFQDRIGPAELCFSQLQRLLNERELQGRQLIESTKSIWRLNQPAQDYIGLTNISAPVIVRGNVIVRGSLIESPQISLIGGGDETITINQIESRVDAYSPNIIEGKLRQATYKLRHVREKLSRAVTLSSTTTIESNATFDGSLTQFNGPVRFFGPIRADKVIFSNGIANSKVKLNGIQFDQLENELVSLRGNQVIPALVKFTGRVTADLLEIDGEINDAYFLKDAFDTHSKFLQVFKWTPTGLTRPPPFEFEYLYTPELGLSHNATFNDIRLGDMITRDNRTQMIVGRKVFKQLTMRKLSLAYPNTPLNGYNIGEIAVNSIHLRNPTNQVQVFNGRQLIFSKPIRVKRLFINGMINRHINISSLLYDSVKTFEAGPQLISGYKRFTNGLTIRHLTTEGAINGVLIRDMFNLNPTPPVADYLRYSNQLLIEHPPITAPFVFAAPVFAEGRMNVGLLNGINITAGAVRRRIPPPLPFNPINISMFNEPPQLIFGRKVFARSLHVERLRMLVPQELAEFNQSYPLVNGLDLRIIQAGLMRQRNNPPLVHIHNLVIDGNLNLPTNPNGSGPSRFTFGNHYVCPLDVIRTKLISRGAEEQLITVPVRVNSLRGRSILLDPNGLNGYSFPDDFVLKSSPIQLGVLDQPVLGHKTFDQLRFTPPIGPHLVDNRIGPKFIIDVPGSGLRPNIVFGHQSSVNNISFDELQTFIMHERQKNSTGETVLQSLTVYGQIRAKKINGHFWPEDILLKSIGARSGPAPPHLHRRIYSPLVFTEGVNLNVENQLVLRGPIHLSGKLNQVNLTEFAYRSVTIGDKEMWMAGRPLSNKNFVGGITVTGDMRSQGLIDGVDFEQMKNRVVTITPGPMPSQIVSHKVFMSDVVFRAPLRVSYLNDFPVDRYLSRARVHDGGIIKLYGKKTITGTLKINRNLLVMGLINGIDFADLRARAISLSPTSSQIDFNKTLTIEGDAFMDNLWIDEKDGMLDGVRLGNLLPIQGVPSREYVIKEPVLSKRNITQGLELKGLVLDCNIACSLNYRTLNMTSFQPPPQQPPYPSIPREPLRPFYVPQSDAPYPPRLIQINGKNSTYMRTTPPYSNVYQSYSPPPTKRHISRPNLSNRNYQELALRRPMAIHYEKPVATGSYNTTTARSSLVEQQLILLRKEIVSLNLIESVVRNNLVVGFIDAPTISVGSLIWTEERDIGSSHSNMASFLELDQVDFPFKPSVYHLSVGVSTNTYGANETKVISAVGYKDWRVLSTLPIDSPNSALFLKITDQQTLFLLVSQDYTSPVNRNQGPQCPRNINYQPTSIAEYGFRMNTDHRMGGIHVYLFHPLEKSSSLEGAFFDLFQTIDLPAVDSFETFHFRGSTYALAASRATHKVHLLLLRGYSGFQVVSSFRASMLERIKVAHALDGRPVLVIYLSNGSHMVMESVII